MPDCKLIHSDESYRGKQELTYFAGISAESAGSTALRMHRVVIPPGGHAKTHLHASHESAIYTISGEAEVLFGERLGERLVCGPGDFVFIPAGVPHQPRNLSATEPCVAIIARTDPNEQESVVLLPELDG
jgi:uncharacterized RmlC-like cupin family protein